MRLLLLTLQCPPLFTLVSTAVHVTCSSTTVHASVQCRSRYVFVHHCSRYNVHCCSRYNVLSISVHATVSAHCCSRYSLLLFTLQCLPTAAHATVSAHCCSRYSLMLFTLQCLPTAAHASLLPFTLRVRPLLFTLQYLPTAVHATISAHCCSRIPNYMRLQISGQTRFSFRTSISKHVNGLTAVFGLDAG